MTATNSRKPRDYRVLSAYRKVIPHVLGVISAETENSAGAFGKSDSEWIIEVFWHLRQGNYRSCRYHLNPAYIEP